MLLKGYNNCMCEIQHSIPDTMRMAPILPLALQTSSQVKLHINYLYMFIFKLHMNIYSEFELLALIDEDLCLLLGNIYIYTYMHVLWLQ